MRGTNRWLGGGIFLAVVFVFNQAVSFADTVLLSVGTPVVTEITPTDYSWAYPLIVDQSGSSLNVNFREGDGAVLYDFAGFTGAWSITKTTGVLTYFSGNVIEDSTDKSNDLDSYNNFNSQGPDTATLQAYVDGQAAGALGGFTDKSTIPNLTFEYDGSLESINVTGGDVGSATLTVYSTYGVAVKSVYGSVTDGNSNTYKGDVDAGQILVASSAPLPSVWLTFIALAGAVALTRMFQSRRGIFA